MRALFHVSLCVLGLVAGSLLCADETAKPKDREFTAAELELIAICDEWQSTLNQWFQESEEIKDEEQRGLFIQQKRDSAPFVPKLIAFEKTHRGTPVGLMAVRKLTTTGMGAYRAESPECKAGLHALEVLGDYGEHPELGEVLRFFEFYTMNETENALRAFVAKDDGVSPSNRELAKFGLASWILSKRDARDYLEQWAADVEAKKIEAPKWQYEGNAALLKLMPPADKLASLVPEAVDILEKLVASNTETRKTGLKSINSSRYIFQADPEATERMMPRLKDMASGILFKERHLQVGRPAPDLKVKLTSGEEFDFSQQRGKLLIVQFSFTGCGPCEATYPTLKELTAKYPERLSVITFMRDLEPGDAKAAVSSGKMTWNVSWDGLPGANCTAWGVVGYPTIYVFGPDGLLVERTLSWGDLQERVEALLK